MEVRIEALEEKKLLGKHISMSLSANKTAELWKGFMQRKKDILNNIGNDLYSIQVYDTDYFSVFDPEKEFVKWACMEVEDFTMVPFGMETFILPAGLYAVFLYRGAARQGASAFRYIFANWIPQSDYLLDNRPHFELLGEKYNNFAADSEEEIWVPIKLKNQD
jgi:AraC family transcriptional regulator